MATRQYHSAGDDNYDHTNATAILVYRGNYTPPACPLFPSNLPSNRAFLAVAANNFLEQLRSLASQEHSVNVPQNITTRMFIVASMNVLMDANGSSEGNTVSRNASSLNNISFLNPSIDVRSAYYWNISGFYITDFPDQPDSYFNFTSRELQLNTSQTVKGSRVKMLNYNEEVEIIFQGTSMLEASETHPMHLHGHNFYVIGSGYGNFNPEIDPKGYNLVDPPHVNTFSVPKSGWVTIRFVANNPGVWYWHCHFDRHLNFGMSTVLIVKNGGTSETCVLNPPANFPRCQLPFSNLLREIYGSDGEVYRFNET